MTLAGFIALIGIACFALAFYGLMKANSKLVLVGFTAAATAFLGIAMTVPEEQGSYGYVFVFMMTAVIGWFYYRVSRWVERGCPLNE